MEIIVLILAIVLICLWSRLSALRKSHEQLTSKVDELNRLMKPSLSKPAKPMLSPISSCSRPKVEVAPPPLIPSIEIQELPQHDDAQEPAPAPKAVIKTAAPAPPKSEKAVEPKPQAFNWEKLFMGNLFNKLGALAIIVGVGIFIKLVSPYFEFTPLRQVVSSYVFGLVLVLTAWRIHRQEMKSYAAVLMGTGFAVFFVATYGATSYYHLMPDWLALCVGTGLVLASYGVAQRFKTLSTMLIGMVGAYANPLIIGSFGSVEFVFTYFIFINAITAVYVWVNQGKYLLNYINLVLTSAYLVAASLTDSSVAYYFPLGLWAVYMLSDLASARKDYQAHHMGLSGLNYAMLMFFAVHLFAVNEGAVIELVLGGLGLLYLCLACLYRAAATKLCWVYTCSGLLALLVAPYFVEHESLRIALWSGLGLCCAALCGKRPQLHLDLWSLASLVALVAASFAALHALDAEAAMQPFFNMRSVHFGMPLLALLGSAVLLWRCRATIARLMSYVALLLTYVYVSREINEFIAEGDLRSLYAQQYVALMEVFAFLGAAMALYRLSRLKLFAITAYGLWILMAMILCQPFFWAIGRPDDSTIWNMGLATLILAAGVGYYISQVIHRHMSPSRFKLACFMEWAVFSLVYLYLAVVIACLHLEASLELYALIALGWVAAVHGMSLCVKTGNVLLGGFAHALFYFALAHLLLIEVPEYAIGSDIPFLNWSVLTHVLGISAALKLGRDTVKVLPLEHMAYAKLLPFLAFLMAWEMLFIELYKLIGYGDVFSFDSSIAIYFTLMLAFVSSAYWLSQRVRFVLYTVAAWFVYVIGAGVGTVLALVYRGDLVVHFTTWPILNTGTLIYGSLLAVSCHLAWGRERKALHYWAIFIGLVLVGLQTCHLTRGWSEQSAEVAVSIAWILYSALLMGWGILRDISYQKLAGTVIVIFSALKIVFYDLSRVDALSKTIAFLLLGAVLMAISYYYTKKKKS